MEKIARCGLYAALFAVFSTVLFTGSSASAASDWDNVIKTTDTLRLSDIGSNYDQTFTWDEFVPLATESCDNTSIHDFVERDYVTIINRYELANARHTIRVIPKDTQQTITWSYQGATGAYIATVAGGTTSNRAYNFYWDGTRIYCQASTGGSTIIGSTVETDITTWLYYSNMDPNYPAGYEGATIPDTFGEVSYKPNITWEYDDLDVTFYSDHEKNTAKVPPNYKIYWFFSNATFDTLQPNEPYARSGCTSPAYLNEYTVPEYFDYGLQAYYADSECNILSQDLDGNILSEQMEVLHIDGSTSSGSSATDSNYIEDSKLVAAIKNISVDQHGLQSLVLAPAQLFTQMATWSGQCSSINLPFIEGKSLSLQCVRSGFSSQYPAIYGTIQLVFSGLIAYFVAIKTFTVIKGANDPEDDKVETYKL